MISFVPSGSHVLRLQSRDSYWPLFYPQASQGISVSQTRKVIWLIPYWRISRAQSDLGRKTHTSIARHFLPWKEENKEEEEYLGHSYTWSQSVTAGRSTAIILKDSMSCDQPLSSLRISFSINSESKENLLGGQIQSWIRWNKKMWHLPSKNL